MSTFVDSPMAYCPRANRYVLLDQTCENCRDENGCIRPDCPLAAYFAKGPMGDAPEAGKPARVKRQGDR